MQARTFKFLTLLMCFLVVPSLFAKEEPREPVARMSATGASAQWTPALSTRNSYSLTVVGPDGATFQREFQQGSMPSFRLQDLGSKVVDGAYTYDLRAIPYIADGVKQQLAEARANDDDAAIARIKQANGIGEPLVQSGTLTVVNGSFINSNADEPAAPRAPKVASTGGTATTSATVNHPVTALDVVTADDEIIQGSLCVGLDCVNNESFGFDTIRLKENNTRIKFDDTSTSAGFPNVDWQLTANDSASGGANKFSIEDITGSKVPFTITAGAPTNSMFVASSGKLGLGNSSPGLNVHITATDTPAIRQEQTNGGGFTAQTWDIGANEANWFVRDLTGGSRLPFRIRPGATTSSIDIASDGRVGVNTASPNSNVRLDVFDSTQNKARVSLTGQEFFQASNTSTDGVALILGVNRTGNRQLWIGDTAALTQNSTNKAVRIAPSSNDIDVIGTDGSAQFMLLQGNGGNLGIGGIITPSNPIQHANGAFLSNAGVWTNASSRAYKQDIEDLSAQEAQRTFDDLKPVKYASRRDPTERHVGFIAEDVPDLVATKDRKGLSPMDIVAVLTKVVQEQQQTIDQLKARLDQLEQKQQ